MFYILCFCLTINQHIIKINNAEDVEILIQSSINIKLKKAETFIRSKNKIKYLNKLN